MTTTSTTTSFEQELKELSRRDLLIIKTTIGIFGIVLNICFFQLMF